MYSKWFIKGIVKRINFVFITIFFIAGCATLAQRDAQRHLILGYYESNIPLFSPDGKKILFATWSEEKRIVIEGRLFKVVPPVASGGNLEIYVMDIDNPNRCNVRNLTNNPAHDGFPSWSSDGKKIVFCSMRDGHSEIYIVNADGSEQRRLTNDFYDKMQPLWSSNGRIYYWVYSEDASDRIITKIKGKEFYSKGRKYYSIDISNNGEQITPLGTDGSKYSEASGESYQRMDKFAEQIKLGNVDYWRKLGEACQSCNNPQGAMEAFKMEKLVAGRNKNSL